MIDVLIVDDHPVVRKGLRQLLEDDREDRFGIIMEAGNERDLMDKLSSFTFDVVLLDISMPGRSGLDLLPDILLKAPDLPVLILSIYPEEQYALRAIKLGASGYLTKNCEPDELINAIVRISEGHRYITPSLSDIITDNFVSGDNKTLAGLLSPREIQVLKLIAGGMTLTKIAKELSLSPKTISTYRERTLAKLNLNTTAELIKFAFEQGL